MKCFKKSIKHRSLYDISKIKLKYKKENWKFPNELLQKKEIRNLKSNSTLLKI